jgi:hypothetical protein
VRRTPVEQTPDETQSVRELDGNVLGGDLAEVFGLEVTASEVTCAGCGRNAVVADLVVYDAGLGVVARCRGCSQVVLRTARIHGQLVVNLQGAAALRAPAPPKPEGT